MRKITYIALLFIGFGCNPDGAGCFESSGSMETIAIALPEFTEVDISGNIEVRLNPQLTNEVLVTAGSNLIGGVRTEVIDGVLYLDNLNKCSFTKGFVSPIVEISNPDLRVVTQHGFGKVISTDTLVYDQFQLIGLDGSGDFEIVVNIRNLTVSTNNIGNFYVSGKADNLSVGNYWNDAIFYCEDLQAINCSIKQNGSNTIHLNVSGTVTGSINSLGNVILHRQMPDSVDVEETNLGQIIYDFE